MQSDAEDSRDSAEQDERQSDQRKAFDRRLLRRFSGRHVAIVRPAIVRL